MVKKGISSFQPSKAGQNTKHMNQNSVKQMALT